MYYISKDNLYKLLDALKKDYQVFVPVKKGEQRFYQPYLDAQDEVLVGEVRAFEPLKAFFSRAREVVADGFKADIPYPAGKPKALVGVKACDLKGFKVQDQVFKDHDYQDPFYIKARQENLIISADCTCCIQTCFCLALGVQPYPKENFDLNLSPVTDGFIVETGSDKGKALVAKHAKLFEQPQDGLAAEREKQRDQVAKQVEENIKQNKVPAQDRYKGMIEKKYKSGLWEDEAKTCLECGACNTICPTCHCFLLYDQKNEQKMARLRIWDSCMIKDFARVAGGANPRPKLWMRLRNRFEKKFDYFPKVADVYACTGCGRCISACPAKIDIRKVLARLVADA
ncbi:MAG: 4Fe-4S dicluster domain-containing protein [Candidatus Omnitrophica bacterium]|nr:4Fe-4S dicluster domain-containing protein [Candidatus Omnitrophota bacterium]